MLTWIGGTKVLPSNFPPEWKMKLKLLFIPFSPLLHEQYPEVEVESNFDENAIFRCQHMVWDDEKQMIVDLLAPEDNEEIGTEENLSGFYFEIEAVTAAEIRPNQILPIQGINPQDDDSVSTLRSRYVTNRVTRTPMLAAPINSSSLVTSQGTTLTNKTMAMLDSRIISLASQVVANQNNTANQLNVIMTALNNLTNQTNSNDPSIGNTSQAGNHINKSGSGSGL